MMASDCEFDDLDIITNRAQQKRVKSFADQRRRVRPRNRHAATKNPVRELLRRKDLRTDTEDILKGPNNINGIQLIGRNKIVATGKLYKEHELVADAKAGLQGKEDIRGAGQTLKTTNKSSTGVSTERINPHDGVKPVMLLQIKGARNIQTRLVKPSVESMNSGDVFILVTPKYVHQWNGKNCSIMEKARGSEVSSVIQQWRELNCNATSVNVMDQGKEREGSITRAFWKALGGKQTPKDGDDCIADKEYEKGILQSSRIYEVVDDELSLMEDIIGKIPSKKWLSSDKAYVMDFGTEVYAWLGRQCSNNARKIGVDLGLKLFEKDFKTDADVSPLFPDSLNPLSNKKVKRPEYSVFGKMTEKSENVLFRRKFFDWPDPVDLSVSTAEGKVLSKMVIDNDYAAPELRPVSPGLMTEDQQEPLLLIEGMLIGRGKGGRDPETLFNYAVETNSVKAWRVSNNAYEEVPDEKCGEFYSAESFIVRWSFQIMRTGIRNIKGGKSKQEDAGKDRIIYFFWQGKDCSVSEKGQAALMTIEIDSKEGPQILVTDGREPAAFYNLFGGNMVVHLGKLSEEDQYESTRMYWIRNEVADEACAVEIPLTSAALRSRGSYAVADPESKCMFLWHGFKTTKAGQDLALKTIKNLRDRIRRLYSITLKISEMEEGDESDLFWDSLNDDEDYISYLEVRKKFDFTPRCFLFDSIHGRFTATEIASSTYRPSIVCPFPVLQSDLYEANQPALIFIDAKYKMYLWQGWWPIADEEETTLETGPNTAAEKHRYDVNRKLAMETIRSYAEVACRPIARASIVYAGLEPLEFKNLFPYWEDKPEVGELLMKQGKTEGLKEKLEVELSNLSKDEYTLLELQERPLPEGVDPGKIEKYLCSKEFETLFGVKKNDFYKLPRWKQIDLKKKNELF